jgi:hypothetical protein
MIKKRVPQIYIKKIFWRLTATKVQNKNSRNKKRILEMQKEIKEKRKRKILL